MGKKIGTLYYDIGAKTDDFKNGLRNSKEEVTKFAQTSKMSFTEAYSAIRLFSDGIGTAYRGLKEIYEIGKTGASFEKTREEFDKLTESIGTTSDALMNDLRLATGGLVSDFELMESAAGFLTLGLVDTHDEAVRLTKVAGQLGMDMNQLTLTLTNQTTMRFDSLGIAVDGFDEKVQALKESGLDANEAFTEAFLQQAEQQIELVGDVAEKSVSSFMRFEASLKNFNIAAQETAAGPIGDIVETLANGLDVLSGHDSLTYKFADLSETIRGSHGSYAQYIEALNKTLEGTGLLINANGELEATNFSGQIKLQHFAETTQWASEEVYNAAHATQGWTKEAYAAYRGLGDASSAAEDFADSADDVYESLVNVSNVTRDYSEELLYNLASAGLSADAQMELADQMGRVDKNTQYAVSTLDYYKKQLEEGKITQEEYNNKVIELRDLMAQLEDKDITISVFADLDPAIQQLLNNGVNLGGENIRMEAGGGFVNPGDRVQWGEYNRPEMFIPRYGGGGEIINPQQMMEMIRGEMSGQKSGGDTYNINITTTDGVGLATYGAGLAKAKATL